VEERIDLDLHLGRQVELTVEPRRARGVASFAFVLSGNVVRLAAGAETRRIRDQRVYPKEE
jgi:hypothetical protein